MNVRELTVPPKPVEPERLIIIDLSELEAKALHAGLGMISRAEMSLVNGVAIELRDRLERFLF